MILALDFCGAGAYHTRAPDAVRGCSSVGFGDSLASDDWALIGGDSAAGSELHIGCFLSSSLMVLLERLFTEQHCVI